MISATEVFRLPSTRLSAEEQATADKIALNIEAAIRDGKMRRHGFEMTTDCTEPAAMFEVTVILRKAGFEVNCQILLEPNRFNPNGPPTHVGYKLNILPSLASLIEADEIYRKDKAQ